MRRRRPKRASKVRGPAWRPSCEYVENARLALIVVAATCELVRASYAATREQPRELQELTARIERLRERLKQGDPDMAADEIEAAIDRAEEKRAELQDRQSAAMPSSKVLTMLPRAAEAYRRQITLGLDGDPRAALKARVILRELFGGNIRLVPQLDGGLMAHWSLHPGALLKGLGTYGIGGSIRSWKSLKVKEVRVR